MALTTQTFSEITGCGTNVRTDARGDERRKDLRVPLRVQASIVPLSGRISGKPTLLCDKPVEAGEALALRLERHGMDAVWVRCRIVRCLEVEPRLFLIGVEFTDVIDLKALMGRSTPAVGATI